MNIEDTFEHENKMKQIYEVCTEIHSTSIQLDSKVGNSEYSDW